MRAIVAAAFAVMAVSGTVLTAANAQGLVSGPFGVPFRLQSIVSEKRSVGGFQVANEDPPLSCQHAQMLTRDARIVDAEVIRAPAADDVGSTFDSQIERVADAGAFHYQHGRNFLSVRSLQDSERKVRSVQRQAGFDVAHPAHMTVDLQNVVRKECASTQDRDVIDLDRCLVGFENDEFASNQEVREHTGRACENNRQLLGCTGREEFGYCELSACERHHQRHLL